VVECPCVCGVYWCVDHWRVEGREKLQVVLTVPMIERNISILNGCRPAIIYGSL